MAPSKVESARLPPDLSARLRQIAEEKGQTFSDVLRDAALALVGECPTCRQAIPSPAEKGAQS